VYIPTDFILFLATNAKSSALIALFQNSLPLDPQFAALQASCIFEVIFKLTSLDNLADNSSHSSHSSSRHL
jgi:hypothetical protein